MKKFSSTMRGNSRQTSRNKKLRNLALFGLITLLLVFFVPRLLGMASSLVFAPVTYIESWLADSGSVMPNYFKDRQKLVKEIESLRRQISHESGTTNTIRSLQIENTSLRNMLGDTGEPRIAAGVIGRPTVTPYDVLILDKGSDEGVVQYAPVYIGFDQAIGYVAEVYKDTSVVTLVTTPGFESTVYIFGPNIYTTARGIGGGVLQVSVPQGIALSVGDLVAVPSFDSGVYGSVDVVDSVPTEPEQRGYVTLDVPLQGLRLVSIGRTALSQKSFAEIVEVVAQTKQDLNKVPVPSGFLVDIETATTSTSTTATTTAGEVEEQLSESSPIE